MNIRKFALLLAAFATTGGAFAIAQEEAQWQSLFDGSTLNGWKQLNGTATYTVEDGAIVGTTSPGSPNSFLCTEKDYGDFVLELEFLVDEALNSGVQIRSQSLPDYKEGRVHGYQVEIDPNQTKPHEKEPANERANGEKIPLGTEPRCWTGGIYDESRRGWLNDLTKNEPARKAFKPGEWNHFRIEAKGDSIKTFLNSVPAADLKDDMTLKGFIGLQVHSSSSETPLHVRWKNIRIQVLDTPEGDAPKPAKREK
ncbi:MAG: hypothetical protein AMXMBFR84_32540 [Candidatus Hydrogenedentota bacterium]